MQLADVLLGTFKAPKCLQTWTLLPASCCYLWVHAYSMVCVCLLMGVHALLPLSCFCIPCANSPACGLVLYTPPRPHHVPVHHAPTMPASYPTIPTLSGGHLFQCRQHLSLLRGLSQGTGGAECQVTSPGQHSKQLHLHPSPRAQLHLRT